MSEKAGSSYREIKSKLEDLTGKGELYFAGEVISYNGERFNPWILEERVGLFVAKQPDCGFDPKKLKDFLESLELKGLRGALICPLWQPIEQANGQTTSRLILGSLMYSDSLKSYEDLLDLPRYQDKIRSLPELNKLHSRREIVIHAYPSQEYANQIYIYQRGLDLGEDADPSMDWLTHSISKEQVDIIEKAGDSFDLRKLSPPPLVRYGFGR